MKLKKWDWYNYLFAAVIFSFGVFFLFKPWFNFFYKMKIDILNIFQQSYFIILVLISTVLAKNLSKIKENKLRFLYLLIFIVIDFIIIFTFSWQFNYFAFYSLIAIITAFRFEMYFGGENFNRDFALAFIFLLMTIILSNNYGFSINYLNIILIFLSGIALSVFFNYENSNSKAKFKLIFYLMSIVFLISIFISFLVPGTTNFIAGYSQDLLNLYYKFVDIIIFIIYPLIWLITPIYNFLIFLINKFGVSGEDPLESMQGSEMEMDLEHVQESSASHPEIGVWLFYIFLAIILLYLATKLLKTNKKEIEEGVIEERESIFSYDKLKNDFNNFVNNIKNNFRKKKKSYNQNSIENLIRKIYYDFLIYYNSYRAYHYSNTPNDYLNLLLRTSYLAENEKEAKKLTKIYNKVRYKEKADEVDLEKAKTMWEKISKED